MGDDLGDRMKLYESQSDTRLMPFLPALARLDGKCFSGFTRGLKRPYDSRLSELMVATTRHLVEETNARVGYTQSDEITLAWYSDNPKSQIWFDGRAAKMTSVLAGMAAVYFNRRLPTVLPEKAEKSPLFDCRVWNTPTLDEAANVFVWRELDAAKNSISMAAQSHYSHRELMNKGGAEKQDMLMAKGVNWNDHPAFFKRGTYVQRRTVARKFDATELEKLPPKHEARTNPDLVVERTEYHTIEMPPITKVTNRVRALFFGEEPKTQAVADVG